MSTAWLTGALVPALVTGLVRVEEAGLPRDEDIGPGWGAFVVVVALCVVTTLLWLSMRKQLGKIRFEEQDTPRRRRRSKPPPE